VAFPPQSQRDQILTLIAVVAFGLVGAYWYFLYTPQGVKVAALSAHVDSLDTANQQAKAQLAKGSVKQIVAEAAAYKENLDLMRTLVPASNEVPALLEQVSTAARRVKLDLNGVEPEPLIEGDMFNTYRYKVKISGSYHDIGEVLTNIASLNRIVAPINLQLVIPGAQPKGSTRQVLNAAFEIQTYVVRTTPRQKKAVKKEPPAGAPPPAGPAKKP
jgi:type IV pilus assembly protein PilO